ncbi:type II toxin-antitoxin system VapC family toxin [Spiribacter roseus]|uniref:Ribonuclease VapC n=1 Tax=Spiribacter roseus TaxID=1855875 RepID=A0ABV3RWE7_9GAMM|nr:type II toxin-antitoxin system VapC family toxin [Spiribacter roseus]KAF0284618.1 recombinase [Spiribacter roseus]
MSYLIDTNVISELRRRTPAPAVQSWFGERDSRSLCLSVLTIGEIRKGAEKIADRHRQQEIFEWLDNDVRLFFADRILTIDEAVAERWGRLAAAAKRPLPVIDSLLAATALTHDLCLVTRNVSDFALPGLDVFNPWAAA